jgi:hypothetical protein
MKCRKPLLPARHQRGGLFEVGEMGQAEGDQGQAVEHPRDAHALVAGGETEALPVPVRCEPGIQYPGACHYHCGLTAGSYMPVHGKVSQEDLNFGRGHLPWIPNTFTQRTDQPSRKQFPCQFLVGNELTSTEFVRSACSTRCGKNRPEASYYQPHRHRKLNQPKRREQGEYDIAAK